MLAILITALLDRSLRTISLTLGILSIAPVGRLARATTISFAEREFVLAARTLGAKNGRIIIRELLPNVLIPMSALALLGMAVAIVAEGGLAFLGLSVEKGPTWGKLILTGARVARPAERTVDRTDPHHRAVPHRAGAQLRRRPNPELLRRERDLTVSRHSNRAVPNSTDRCSNSTTFERISRPNAGCACGRRRHPVAQGGESLGIVGESGSGKTVLSRSIMGLLPSTAVNHGSVRFAGQEILGLGAKQMRHLWGAEMSMVFQNPLNSLNPLMKIGKQIIEPLKLHLGMDKATAAATAVQLLRDVRIPEAERRLHQYPHELSGGMRQRVMIAIALACGPTLLFADEPTTALDVTVQAQILDLHRRAATRPQHVRDPRDSRPRRRRRTHRSDRGDVRRQARRACTHQVAVRRHEDAVHEVVDAQHPAAGRSKSQSARDDSGSTARPRQPAGWVQLRTPLSVRATQVSRRGAAAHADHRSRTRLCVLVPGRLTRIREARR